MRSSKSKNEAWLRRALERAFLAAIAAPAVVTGTQACSSNEAAPADAGLGADASISDGGALDDGGTVTDADLGPCAPFPVQIDAQAPDGGVECGVFQKFPCGPPSGLTLYSDCYYLLDDCDKVCPGSLFFNCHVYGDSCIDGSIPDASDIVIECATCPNGVGRRPEGLLAAIDPNGGSRVGDYFARAAHLEAAAVHAFRAMHRELACHGAPAELLSLVRSAEADEIRHARVTSKLARTRGAKPVRARVKKMPVRPLEEMAIENAIEGCVRETFGALYAKWQANAAGDTDVAEAMSVIADDEAKHAALSWRVAAWLDSQLDDAARERVAAATERAISELEREIDREPHHELVEHAGVPSAAVQKRLLRALVVELAA